MKLMITLNVERFVNDYNNYAVMFEEELITKDTVYKLLNASLDFNIVTTADINYFLLKPSEVERFAALIIEDGWKEIVLNNATKISFFR